MAESPLEVLRRQIREAETRIKHTAEQDLTRENPLASIADPKVTSQSTLPVPVKEPSLTDPGKLVKHIRQLKTNFRVLVRSCRDAILHVNSDGAWELSNSHLADWLGYTPDEFHGTSIRDLFEP